MEDGQGAFNRTGQNVTTEQVSYERSVYAGDIDGDGDVDVLSGT